MEIVKFPDARLFVKCKEVTVFGKELKLLLDSMWETMVSAKGIGLAANQVGLSFRMFVMQGPNNEKIYLVNPKILSSSVAGAGIKEGCLSAPGEFINLGRAVWVQVSYQDEEGKPVVRVFKDVHSVCVQHEIDHLEGKSFLQSEAIPKAKRRELAKKWGLNENRKRGS